MSGLEQYAIPHDPDSIHQLHWTPGSHGKGLVTPEGVVHHWNVSGLDGQPQHRRYIMESPGLGFDPYSIDDDSWRTGDWYDELNPFWIHPDGALSMLDADQDPAQVTKVDPRLGPPHPEDEWHIGKLADLQHQNRGIDTSPPNIVNPYPQDAHPDAITRNGYYARRPFVYHAPTNTVYVGGPGEHHDHVYLQHKLDITEPEHFEGSIIKGYPGEGKDSYPDQASWFNRAPANHEQILNDIATTFGVPPDHYKPQAWHFADLDERAQDRTVMDPIAFERKYDWDRVGDVQRGHPDIEWVPTGELKKFIEYDRRPGGKDSENNQERWEALGGHLKTQGFKNPIWLDFNPDTGTAHMSEGNHRAQIALDHGIPAMPVRVYRSRRTSPTQVPVKLQVQPEWEDHFSPEGYRVPQNLRPSHIGLMTVPPPNQRTAAMKINEGRTDPRLGVYGNMFDNLWLNRQPAISHGGQVYIGQPGCHHVDVIKEFALPSDSINRAIDISLPDRQVSGYNMTEPHALHEVAQWATQKYKQPYQVLEHPTSDWNF